MSKQGAENSGSNATGNEELSLNNSVRASLLKQVLNEYLSTVESEGSGSEGTTEVLQYERLPELIELIHQHRLLYPPTCSEVLVKKWVAKIMTFLHSRDFPTRWAAVQLMAETVRCCAYTTLSQYYKSWFSDCFEVLKRAHGESESIVSGTIAIVNLIIKRLILFPDLRRELLSSNDVQSYVSSLAAIINPSQEREIILLSTDKRIVDDHRIESAFSGISVAARHAGPSIRSGAQRLEESCILYLQHPRQAVRAAAAKLLVLVSHCCAPSKGKDEKKAPAYDIEPFSVLTKLNSSVTDIFDRCLPEKVRNGMVKMSIENDKYIKIFQKHYTGTDLKLTPIETLRFRLDGIITCICQFLSHSYGTAMTIPLNQIMHTITRLLSITPHLLLQCPEEEFFVPPMLLIANLPFIHTRAYDFLSTLMTSAKKKLLPYGSKIASLLVTSLAPSHYPAMPPQLRVKIYETLQLFVANIGGLVDPHFTTTLIAHIVDDITPVEAGAVAVSAPIQNMESAAPASTKIQKAVSKKKKVKRAKTVMKAAAATEVVSIESSASSGHDWSRVDPAIGVKALETAKSVLICGGGLLPGDLIISLFSAASNIVLSYTLQLDHTRALLRLAATELLHAIIHVPSPSAAQLTASIVSTLHSVAYRYKDTSVEISTAANCALASVESLVHPRAPTQILPPIVLADEIRSLALRKLQENTKQDVLLQSRIESSGSISTTQRTQPAIASNQPITTPSSLPSTLLSSTPTLPNQSTQPSQPAQPAQPAQPQAPTAPLFATQPILPTFSSNTIASSPSSSFPSVSSSATVAQPKVASVTVIPDDDDDELPDIVDEDPDSEDADD